MGSKAKTPIPLRIKLSTRLTRADDEKWDPEVRPKAQRTSRTVLSRLFADEHGNALSSATQIRHSRFAGTARRKSWHKKKITRSTRTARGTGRPFLAPAPITSKGESKFVGKEASTHARAHTSKTKKS